MLEEWCGSAPGRLIPATLIPFWDVQASVRELQRCVAKGSRGVIFTENPAKLKFKGVNLPSIHSADGHWDPLWAAVQEAAVPICMHYGSSSEMSKTALDAPPLVELAANSFILPISTTLDWIFSGNLGRFPGLRVCMSESQIGWVVPMLERAEYVTKVQGGWGKRLIRTGTMGDDSSARKPVERDVPLFDDARSPTEIFRDQIFCCFFQDYAGMKAIRDIDAIDNVMIEMDYPHSDSTWPHSLDVALEQVANLTDEEKWKVLAGNAMRLHSFAPSYPVAA
jgi:predicted TIM-barrel fold metal-dependent hydrolase